MVVREAWKIGSNTKDYPVNPLEVHRQPETLVTPAALMSECIRFIVVLLKTDSYGRVAILSLPSIFRTRI